MIRLWPRGLRARLLGLLLSGFLVPALLVGALVTITVRRSLLEAAGRESAGIARRLADQGEFLVDSSRRRLRAAVLTLDPGSTPGASFLEALLRKNTSIAEAQIRDDRGRLKTAVFRKGDRLLRDEDPRRGALPDLTGPTVPLAIRRGEQRPSFYLSIPIPRSRGTLVARVSMAGLADLLSPPLGKPGSIAILDPNGNPIFSSSAAMTPSGRRVVKSLYPVGDTGWLAAAEFPTGGILAPARRLAWRVTVLVFFLGVLFTWGAVSWVGKTLAPLESLREDVRAIGQGDFSRKVESSGDDEIHHLAGDINAMARSLRNLEKTKQDLTHMIVHDLKSPLTSVLGSIDYVLTATRGSLSPDQRKLLTLGAKSGRDLLRLIQNLLDVARMEEGKLELKKERFSLLDMAGQCVDDLESIILRERKMISVDIAPDLPGAWADRDLVHRVLANLLINALKHTPQGTEISITVDYADDARSALVVRVRDTGEGIPLDFQEKIFEKFGQAEGKKQNYRVGSGLGLTFCKMAVEAHGGRIAVDSAPGQGSAFYFTLPLPKPGEAPERAKTLPAAPSVPVPALPAKPVQQELPLVGGPLSGRP
jgi:signal transduction histidine kinase